MSVAIVTMCVYCIWYICNPIFISILLCMVFVSDRQIYVKRCTRSIGNKTTVNIQVKGRLWRHAVDVNITILCVATSTSLHIYTVGWLAGWLACLRLALSWSLIEICTA